MYTASKVVIEIFSLSDGKAKLLNPELVRRIISRERERGLTIVFPLGEGVKDINWLEQVKSNQSQAESQPANKTSHHSTYWKCAFGVVYNSEKQFPTSLETSICGVQ
jgi:hypothetical protein